MRRIQFLLVGALVATSFAACKDDETDPKPPVEIDCTKPENANHKDCVVTGDTCEDTFTPPEGDAAKDLCTSDADKAAYAAAKDTLADTAQTQGIGCGGLTIETAADLNDVLICTSCAVSDKADITPGCASCITDVVACALQNCVGRSGDGPSCPGDTCDACLEEFDCEADLDTCTGLGAPAAVDCTVQANFDDAACSCELPANAELEQCLPT